MKLILERNKQAFVIFLFCFQIAREHSIRFMETSAKANINIEKAFNELASAILDKTAGRDPQEPADKVQVDKRNAEKSAVSRCC